MHRHIHAKVCGTLVIDFESAGISFQALKDFAGFLSEIWNDMEIKCLVNGLEKKENNRWGKWEEDRRREDLVMKERSLQRERKKITN